MKDGRLSRRRAILTLLTGASAGALLGCKRSAPQGGTGPAGSVAAAVSEGGAKKRIAVIPKGTTHEFWKTVHAGAVKASREADVALLWKGPLKEDDLKSQIDVVQSFIALGVDGIVLAPLSDTGLRGSVKAAIDAKVPVVIFDSDLSGVETSSFVATGNVLAGRMAADHMAKVLGEAGNVVVLRYQEGSASTLNRERGFLDAIREHPRIRIVSDNQYGGATTETAFAKSETLLMAQKAAAGEVQGVFTPNESTTFGMLLALRKAGLAGKVHFVGFDASDKLVAAVRDRHIDGLVVQDPFRMGYLAVRAMAQAISGEHVEKRIDTGAKLVTAQNLGDPDIKQLVAPDLKQWLED
jgi:ribose transport system substrate-binding protein